MTTQSDPVSEPQPPPELDEFDDEPTREDYRRLVVVSGSCLLFMVAAFFVWLALARLLFG